MNSMLIDRNGGGRNPNLGKNPRKSNLSNVFYMFKKDITYVYREKVVFALLILMPISFAFTLTACGPLELENVPTAIFSGDNSDASQLIVESFRGADEFKVKNIHSEEKAVEMVKDGDAVLAIIIPEDFGERIESNEKMNIKIIVDGSKPDVCAPTLAAASGVLRKSSTQLGTIILKEKLEVAVELEKDMREMKCTFVGARQMLNEMQEVMKEMEEPVKELSSSAFTLSSSLEEMKKVPSFVELEEMSTELENTEREIETLDGIISDFEDVLDTIEDTPIEPILPWDVGEASESIDTTRADMNALRKRLSFFQEILKEIDATIDSALIYVEEMQASLGAIGSGAESNEEIIESTDEQMEDALIIIGMMDDDIKKISGLAVGISSAIEPFTISESNIYGKGLEPRDFYATAFIPSISMLIAGVLGALLISTEKERGTFESLITSPIPARDIIVGKVSAGMAIGVLQINLILGIVLGLGVMCRGSIPLLLFIGMLVVLIGIGLGMLVGTIMPTSMAAVMGSFLGVFAVIVVGGLLWPIEVTPWLGKFVAAVTPLTPAIDAFRAVMIKGYGFSGVAMYIVILIGWALAMLLASVFVFKKMSRRE